jgi:hypothetical protein
MISPPGLEANLTLRFLTHAAQAGPASGFTAVLLAAAAFAALGAVAGFAYGPDPTRQPPPSRAPRRPDRPAAHPPAPAIGGARNDGTLASPGCRADSPARPTGFDLAGWGPDLHSNGQARTETIGN